MKWCCVFWGEFNTLASCPKTNYIGTNFLDAREFSEGSQETVALARRGALAKKCWGKVDKYLSLDSGNNVDGRGRPLVSESDESQLNGLMFVHCEKSNKREPSEMREERCLDWEMLSNLCQSGLCWRLLLPSAMSSNKTKRFVGNTCDAAVFNIPTKEFLISSLNFLSNNVVWSGYLPGSCN